MNDPLLTEKQASEALQTSPRTLQRWRTTGGGPQYVRIGQRKIAYRRSSLEKFAESRTFESIAAELASEKAA